MNFSLSQMFSRSLASTGPAGRGPAQRKTRGPRKRRRGSNVLLPIAGILAAVLVVVAGGYFLNRPVTLRIAVGPPNSDDAKVVQALAQSLGRERGYIRLRVISTDGATASATALEQQTADLAVIRGDLNVPKDSGSVAILRKNVVVLWVPNSPKAKKAKSAAIKTIQNLSGRKVGVIGRTQANVNILKLILRQYGVDPAKVEVVQFSTSEITEAVRDHKVDAFIAAGPLNSRITSDAINASVREGGTPTFLAIDAADAIAQNFSAYEASEIPAGSFNTAPSRPDEEVKTISFAHHIVARRAVSETTIATFTRQLFSVRQTVLREVPQAAKLEAPDTDKDANIPAHPGAAAYVDGEEKSFMDRYSDFIWFGIMGLSALGSAGAWFASYMRRDERENSNTMRGRLLEMLSAARKAGHHEELDAMQGEADEILKDTLHCYEEGAIDEGPLTAFNIALDQLHAAIADRRTVLMETPTATRSQPRSAVA